MGLSNLKMSIIVSSGRTPIWAKEKPLKPELAGQLTDDQYSKVLWAAENELTRLLKLSRKPADETAKS
jgi:hypothetical protein